MKNIAKKMMGLIALAVLTLGGVTEVKAQTTTVPSTWTSVRFNNDVRYSQWIINSRIADFYANSTHVGFGVFDGSSGEQTTAPITTSKLDYVPGLVAKAIVENVKLNKDYSWAAPWYYSMKKFGDTYYSKVSSNGKNGKSQDDLNGIKMFFALKDLTATGATYENNTTNGYCNTALGYARQGLNNLNNNYFIGNSTNSGVSAATATTLGMYGGWFHKSDYTDQMWCDGLYMGPALLAQLINEYGDYEKINGNAGEDDWDLITRLFTISWNQLYDSNTGLLYHAFTANPKDDASAYWEGISNTDPKVYHSAAFWGRACGWYFLALVDILEQMQIAGLNENSHPQHSYYTTLSGYLNSLAAGLANYQDATTGCWYQVLDEKDSHLDGNYLESSCTAIFTAAYLKGIRLGYFTADYTSVAQKAYEGCVNQFMMFDNNNEAQLIHCCASAGLGGSAHRSGSRSYYITGSDVTQRNTYTEGKVLGGFILAATEYERAYQASKAILFSTDLKASYDLQANGSITIEACGADDAEISYEWYKVGEANAVATGATFTPTASGSYYCKATSGTTTIQSSTTNVTVPGVDTETPVFTTDLAATATATEGVAKTLTVAANHVDGYQWYSNTTASNTGGTEIENATSASYTFTPNATGTLYYYCVATNSKATGTQSVASAVCTVTVNEAPAETTYTVTFNATTNGGTCATASLTQASSGASITLPAATKDGNTFNGWYTASTGGTLRGIADASYTPTANETLYAQFTENSDTGESETNAPATVSYGTGGAAKTFLDVANTKSNTTIASNSAKCVTFGLYELHKNWKPAWANEITNGSSSSANYTNASDYGFLTGSGSGSGTSANKSATSGYGLIKYTDSAIGIFYVTGVTGIAVMGKDNNTSNEKRLYIKVEEYGTDGTLTAVGGSDGITKSSYNTSLHITEYTAGTLEGTKYYKVSLYSGSSNNEETSQIRFTKYEGGGDTPTPTTYTVSYNMNGHGTAIAAVEGATALPSTLPTPEATGYIFGGWYIDSGLSTAATAGASISADTELFAKWTEKAAATVSINPNSGNVTVGSTLDISSYVTAGSSTGAIGYSTGDATKATVTNAGVITGVAEGSATITISQAEDANYKAGSVTFTVTVNAAPVPTTNYTVKFWNGETQFGYSQSIEEGSTVSAPTTNPTKDGYTFKGWALENGSTVRVTFPYPIYEDVNFYAVWSNTTSGGGGGNFSATATATLSVAADASNTEITSTNATISGGSMYVYNGQSEQKDLITKKGEYAFQMTNNNTFFKVTLDKALIAGDKIKADIYGPKINSKNEEQPRGLWMSTETPRPSSATATLSVTNTSTSSDAWLTSSDYTVTTGDGICGETTFYIYRATANSTYFTDFTITTSSTGDDTNITLETVSDYDDFESYAGEGKTVTFKRSFNNGKWTTLVLPFNVTAAQLGAAFEYANECELANIQSMTVTAQGTGSISYKTTSHITANTPILAKIRPNDGLSGEGFTANEYKFTGVTVVNPESAEAVTATSNDGKVTMYGVYKNTASADIDNNSYFLSGGKFYDWSWLSNMTPFTAYIVPQTTSGNTLKGLAFEEDNATGINETLRYENETLRYENVNLAGQKVGKDYKGLKIKKGVKIIDNR